MKVSHSLAAVLCLASFCGFAGTARADDPAPFNLAGPKVSMRVTRGTRTLPIAQVPNLQSGDKLWVKADLPADQSNHLLLVVAFLRGTTNEPPDNWFTAIETWNKKTHDGTTITVPEGAEQVLLFLAPETGGDFDSLRSTVKHKPGQFIRADADLVEASFEQQRIERYLNAMKTVPPDDPKAIHDRSAKLAATLGLKPKEDCFKQPVDQQVNCLTQSSAPLILGDTQTQSLAEALSNGPGGDLVNQASYTPPAGGGVYSAYVGAVVDVVRLAASLWSGPDYQYIPGLSFPEGETLNLKLNTAPSFKKPKTVIVIGLPFVQKDVLPKLRPQQRDQVACLLQPKMPLPVTGAPLVFSTAYAQNLVLHLNRTTGAVDIPLKPDAFDGGLVAQNADLKAATGGDRFITGTVRGNWGFDSFEGPTLNVQQIDGGTFKVAGDAHAMAGKDIKVRLQGEATGCVQHIALLLGNDDKKDVTFKPAEGDKAEAKNTLELSLPLKDAKPGDYSLMVQQYGKAAEDKVPLTAYNSAIKLDSVKLHAGDSTAVLTGEGVADVASVEIAGTEFKPSDKGVQSGSLDLTAKTGVTPRDGAEATATLKDGRKVKVRIDTEAARPALKLVSMKVAAVPAQGSLPVALTGKNEIPLEGKLTLVLQSEKPFDHAQRVEVATVNGGAHTVLSIADNTITLQDEHTAICTLFPQKAFGNSAFGKLQMRPVSADGVAGDWSPVGTLVRVPQIDAIDCPAGQACTVKGKDLFLVEAFSATPDFAKPAIVPTGYSEAAFTAPAPGDGGTLYLKLRDDPDAVAKVQVPAGAESTANAANAAKPPAQAAAATAGRVTAAPQQ